MIVQTETFYTFASGALGWNLPAAVGLALGEQASGRNRPVIALMGDGSFQYSVQGIYTGVQHKTQVIYVVFQNWEYCILKEFTELEATPNVPGLDLPGLDIVSLGRGYGASSQSIQTLDELRAAYTDALRFKGITVLVVQITPELSSLLG